MQASTSVKRESAERRFKELAARRLELRDTRVTWRNRAKIREELEEINLTIEWLLDHGRG
jgi:hypothetical protein